MSAIKIDKDNFSTLDPGVLSEMVHDNKAVIIESSIEGLVAIVNHIIKAAGERKGLRKRIEDLESAIISQRHLNSEILKLINKTNPS